MFSNKLRSSIEASFKAKFSQAWPEFTDAIEDADEDEITALKYLYTGMNLSDRVNMSPNFYLQHVRETLDGLKEAPWADQVDERMILSDLIPLRSSNEDLTLHRKLFRDILSPLIQGLSMTQAALRVNVWCFSQATYESTDSRTASPLTIRLRAAGRCGEETAFAVAAMRSVGIPARNVFTPRWAHQDDNHAWIEVWTDDAWHYMGACEPEATPDKAWFSDPATRALLILSDAPFPDAPEPIVESARGFRRNLSSRYYPTAKLELTLMDGEEPVKDASVSLGVVNYGSYAPLAVLQSDQNGYCSIDLGLGTVWLRISHEGEVYESMVSLVDGDSSLAIDIRDPKYLWPDEVKLTFTPPIPGKPPESTDFSDSERLPDFDDLKAAAEEERNAYMATFSKDDGDKSTSYLAKSRGNQAEIRKFLEDERASLEAKLQLLDLLKEKDLSDTDAETLIAHVLAASQFFNNYPKDIFEAGILEPRLIDEKIEDWRPVALQYQNEKWKEDPSRIPAELAEQFESIDAEDHPLLSISPLRIQGVKKISRKSYERLILAVARSQGIPARRHPSDHRMEYYLDEWKPFFEVEETKRYKLKMHFAPSKRVLTGLRDYGLARIDGSQLVPLPLRLPDVQASDSIETVTLDMLPGEYQLLLADREDDGTHHIELKRFTMPSSSYELQIRRDQREESLKTLGAFPRFDEESFEETFVLALLEPDAEPSTHFMNEWLRAGEGQEMPRLFVIKGVGKLPQEFIERPEVTVLEDNALRLEFYDKTLKSYLEEATNAWPLWALVKDDTVYLAGQGYHVGRVDRILELIETFE